MRKVLHKENTRGFADHGWLKAKHSFSFASWYAHERMNFGVLRVLNDDIIVGGEGFGTHPHENMEIVTIPLKGKLAHKDSEGNEEVIHANEVQVMSAGTGINHSEYNASETEDANTLQIWIMPDKKGHSPRYAQKKFKLSNRKNKFQSLVFPDKNEGNLWLNQDAYFSIVDLDSGNEIKYALHSPKNGIYVFAIEGSFSVAEETLNKRDAIGIWDISEVEFNALDNSTILIIEVPMS